MTTTDPLLTLLALAEKDGKPVHPGLQQKCGGDDRPHKGRDLPCCRTLGFIPNADLGSLIAACHIRGWELYSGLSEIEGKICVELDTMSEDRYNVHAHTFEAALLDAAVQATAGVKPDNWELCPPCWDPTSSEECICHGIDYVIHCI